MTWEIFIHPLHQESLKPYKQHSVQLSQRAQQKTYHSTKVLSYCIYLQVFSVEKKRNYFKLIFQKQCFSFLRIQKVRLAIPAPNWCQITTHRFRWLVHLNALLLYWEILTFWSNSIWETWFSFLPFLPRDDVTHTTRTKHPGLVQTSLQGIGKSLYEVSSQLSEWSALVSWLSHYDFKERTQWRQQWAHDTSAGIKPTKASVSEAAICLASQQPTRAIWQKLNLMSNGD